jgi:hypothetical protein
MSKALAITALCASVIVAACLSEQRRSTGAEVFRDLARFVGQTVRICGYIHDRAEDANIWISRRAQHEPNGLGLEFFSDATSRRPTKWDNRVTCVTGRVERTGCGRGELICNETYFQYEIRLSNDKGVQ